MATAPATNVNSGDLTGLMSPFLDPHLLLVVLQGLKDKGIYQRKEIDTVMCKLLDENTNLIGLLAELRPEKEVNDRLREVGDRIDEMTKRITPILQLVEDQNEFEQCSNYTQLHEKHGITTQMIEEFYEWIFENYQCGLYEKAFLGLNTYNQILAKVGARATDSDEMNTETFLFQRNLNVKWGMLASFIVSEKWEYAGISALLLDELLDGSASQHLTPKKVLAQRTWLLHWILFILFRVPHNLHENPQIQETLDLFLSEKYLALISLECPHLLRYVAAAFLIYKRKHMTKDLVHVLIQDRHAYSDPLTEFILALHGSMDFDAARQHFFDFQQMAAQDFFLWDNHEILSTNARFGIFWIYCRIHRSVDIACVAEKMGMQPEKAEAWIVDMIQSGKLKATIDNSDEQGALRLFFPKTEMDVYSQVMSKTKNMSSRLIMLAARAATIVKKESYNVTSLSSQIAQHLVY